VAVVYIIIGIMACIGAIRQIVIDAVNYSLFANLGGADLSRGVALF
jgi:hypothetical protein